MPRNLDDPFFRRELQHCRLFKGVSLESVLDFLQQGTFQELKQGDCLIQAGQSNQSIYLLLSGCLTIRLKNDLEPIAVLGPGDVVGELSVIDGQLASAFVTAEQDVRLLALGEKTMWAMVDSNAAIARNLLFILGRRLRHLTNQQLQREYAHYTVMDALTGLYNRHWLDSMLAREIQRCKRGSQPLSILIIDVDCLQDYGRKHGRAASNSVLQTIAAALRENLRPGEMIARYANDEFMVLLADTDLEAAGKLGERLREIIGASEIENPDLGRLPSVTVSVGVVEMTEPDTPERLIAVADEAVSRAKESGGNCLHALRR